MRISKGQYPCLVVERKTQDQTLFGVKFSQISWTFFSRVPKKGEFIEGNIYCSDGSIFSYSGSSGPLRVSHNTATASILDNLVFPSVFYKIISIFVYYGPSIREVDKIENPVIFKEKIYENLLRYETKKSLSSLSVKWKGIDHFRSIIEDVNWWIVTDGGTVDC